MLIPLRCRLPSQRRLFTTTLSRGHDNPLGLPQNNSRIAPQVPRRGGLPAKRKIPNVKHVVLVSSCKGGVGKSTIAVNLAVSLSLLQIPQLQNRRLRVGILDLDVFGPSVPTLMGLRGVEEPELTKTNALIPITNHGIPTMSMAYLLPPSPSAPSDDGAGLSNEDTPVVWRGLMVQKAVQQLLFQTDWSALPHGAAAGSGLDVLVVDLPPGTGDIPLSVGQLVEVDSTVMITTPDILSLSDVRRGVAMFRKLEMPITGLVVNNSYFVCESSSDHSAQHFEGREGDGDGCGKKHYLFGSSVNDSHGAFNKGVKAMGLSGDRILAELPLVVDVGRGAERGVPYALSASASGAGRGGAGDIWRDAMRGVAGRVWEEINSNMDKVT